MTELELLKVIGYAQDAHILDADEMPVKKKIVPFNKLPKAAVRAVAAVLAVVLAVGLFLQTPMGVAAAEIVKEKISQFLDILFPPKELVVNVEGTPETIHHEAQGREPEADAPGFAIYVDTDRYTMTEENGSWFIRPIPVPYDREEIRKGQAAILEDMTPEEQEAAIDKRLAELEAFYASLPPIEMEIQELPGKAPVDAAVAVRAQMEGKWESLSDIWGYGQPVVLSIEASQGLNWDSPQESHYFRDNSKGGCFHIAMRSYLEATDTCTRFMAMLDTFTIVAPQDTSQYSGNSDALLNAMREEVTFAQEQSQRLLDAANQAENQADINTAVMEREALWLQAHEKLWNALEQTLDETAFQDLLAEHLEWSTQKRIAIEQILEELGGGSMSGTAVYGESAKWEQARVPILLSYLEGTATPASRDQSLILSPDAMVEEFTNAYFSGNMQTIGKYLSTSFSGEVETYTDGNPVIHATKGLDNIPQDMTERGILRPSVEFFATPESDSYLYLSITLVWENGHWAVTSYGLEA